MINVSYQSCNYINYGFCVTRMADGRMVREFVSYCGYSSLEDMLDKGIFDWPEDKFWDFKDQYGSIPLIVQEEILDLAQIQI